MIKRRLQMTTSMMNQQSMTPRTPQRVCMAIVIVDIHAV